MCDIIILRDSSKSFICDEVIATKRNLVKKLNNVDVFSYLYSP